MQSRSPIISVYGPSRTCSCRRAVVSGPELSAFSIVHHYGYPDFSLGDLAAKIKDNPSREEQSTRDIVTAILAQAAGGKAPFGSPIAIAREMPAPPLLIEGYKRSMAVLWSGRASVEIYLCTP